MSRMVRPGEKTPRMYALRDAAARYYSMNVDTSIYIPLLPHARWDRNLYFIVARVFKYYSRDMSCLLLLPPGVYGNTSPTERSSENTAEKVCTMECDKKTDVCL